MNEQDNEYLRCIFAGFKSVTGADAEECFRFADEMIEARSKESSGIVAVKRKYHKQGEVK
jgi:hypothetical protein